MSLHFVALVLQEQEIRQGQHTLDSDDHANEICIGSILLEPVGKERLYSGTGRGWVIVKAWPDHVRSPEINICDG